MNTLKNTRVSYKAIASVLCVLMPLGLGVYSYSAYAQEQKSGSIKIIDQGQQQKAPTQSKPRTTIQIKKDNVPVTATGRLTVRGATHERYDRLVFDWPSKTNYTPKTEGNVFTLTFDKAADADIATIIKKMPLLDSVTSKQTSPFSISIVMKDKVVPDTFHTDNRVVVDFKKDLKLPDFAKPTDKKFETEVQKTAEDTKKPVEEQTVPSEQKTTEKAEQKAEAETTPKTTPTVVANPMMPDASTLVNLGAASAKSASVAKAREQASKEITSKGERLTSGDVISVSSLNPLNLAVFTRGGTLWIVQSALQGIPPVLRQGKQIETKSIRDRDAKTEAWLFPIADGAHPIVKRSDFSWEISIERDAGDVHSVPVATAKATYKEQMQDVVRIKLGETPQILRFEDPFIGDEIITVPVSQSARRVYKAASLPKFNFVPAVSGVVIDPVSDGLDVFAEADEIVIADASGLDLSVPDQTQRQATTEKKKNQHRLFTIDEWLITNHQDFLKNKHKLEIEASLIEDDAEKAPKLLQLAKFYFANGFAREALGYLRTIEMLDESVKNNPSFIAFKGIVHSLSDMHEEAIELFETPTIANEGEIALWRGYSLANLGEWKKAYDNFASTGDLITDYPEPIRSKMILALAEASVSVFDAVNTKALVDLLDAKEKKSDREKAGIQYLKARMAILNRDNETAEHLLEAGTKSPDRYYRAKAALDLLKLRMRSDEITNKEAAEILERLRYVWRDDGYEVEVLEILAQTYIGMNDYRRGLTSLRSIVPLIEEDKEKTAEVTEKLTGYFKKLFVDGDAANLPPLTALALYDEFSELTPVGSEGDVAIQKLAERMVEMDLLDRAAKLLEHQIKFRLTGIEATRVGNRLAAIRLLDSNPEKALEVLDKTKPEDVPAEFVEERKLLRARAYSQMNQPDKALETLSGLNSEMAHRLNVDINWKAGRWDMAAKAIDPLLGMKLKENNLINEAGKVTSLNDEASDLVLNQAVAYTLAGQLGYVRGLADAYGTAMAQTKNAALFQLITRAPKPGQLADLQTLQSHVGEVDIFKSFLDAYKTQAGSTPQTPMTEAPTTTPATGATPPATGTNPPANQTPTQPATSGNL